MLRTHLPDYRRSSEAELREGLGRRDPLALAEAYHRTVPAAHACARRLLGTAAETEALLRTVYAELWTGPPAHAGLEAWVRARCFALASAHLHEVGRAPASPSAGELLADLPAAERSHEPVEAVLASLDEDDRRILLRAHDEGVSTAEADDPRAAAAALERALLALAGPESEAEAGAVGEQHEGLPLGDWVLGLLAPADAERVQQEVSARSDCATWARLLRRGRRRLEGLPPTPDMGQRVLATVLAGAAAPAPGDDLVSALDTDLDEDELGGEKPAVEPDEPGEPEPEPEPEPGPVPEPVDDVADDLWADEEPAPAAKPRWGRRVLALLGWLVLIGLGVVAGMYVGSLLAGP